METMVLRLSQAQVARECQDVLAGIRSVNAGLRAGDPAQLWMGVEVAITAAGRLSRTLWSAGGVPDEGRRALRESLDVEDSSLLRYIDPRGRIPDYDRTLDAWWMDTPADFSLEAESGSPRYAVQPDEGGGVMDTVTTETLYRGQRVNLRLLGQEVEALAARAATEAAKPHWEAP